MGRKRAVPGVHSLVSIKLKYVPKDVLKIILDQQAKEKFNRSTRQFSCESTVYKIIREFKRCQDKHGYETIIGK